MMEFGRSAFAIDRPLQCPRRPFGWCFGLTPNSSPKPAISCQRPLRNPLNEKNRSNGELFIYTEIKEGDGRGLGSRNRQRSTSTINGCFYVPVCPAASLGRNGFCMA